MSVPWMIAVVTLWILLAVVAVAVVALARQVGLLHLRVKPIGPGRLDTGPRVGTVVSLGPVTSLRSHPYLVVDGSRIGFVLFVSPGCGLCKPVLKGAARLLRSEPDLRLSVAVDAEAGRALQYLDDHDFHDGVLATDLAQLDSGHRPYAVGLNEFGLVLASGAVNTLEQLENLVDEARHRSARAGDGDAHDEIPGHSEGRGLEVNVIGGEAR